MNIIDRLSCTRVASWSDKKHHSQKLEALLATQKIGGISKAYVLGYAVADLQTTTRIESSIEQKNASGLRQVFHDLPYEEDELGLVVTSAMCSVYLLTNSANRTFVAVIGSFDEHSSSHPLLSLIEATGFPHWLVLRKILVIE